MPKSKLNQALLFFYLIMTCFYFGCTKINLKNKDSESAIITENNPNSTINRNASQSLKVDSLPQTSKIKDHKFLQEIQKKNL